MHPIESTTYTFESGHNFTVNNTFTCASTNLIYTIICEGCYRDYIGQQISYSEKIWAHVQRFGELDRYHSAAFMTSVQIPRISSVAA